MSCLECVQLFFLSSYALDQLHEVLKSQRFKLIFLELHEVMRLKNNENYVESSSTKYLFHSSSDLETTNISENILL